MTEAIHYTNLIPATRLANSLVAIRGMKERLNLRTSPDSEVTIALVNHSAPIRVGDALRVVQTMEESVVAQLQVLGIDTTERPKAPNPKLAKKTIKEREDEEADEDWD